MNFYQLHILIESTNEGIGSWLSNFGNARPQNYSKNPQINTAKAKFVSDNAGTFGKEQPIIQWVQSIPDQFWPLADCLARQWGLNYHKDITNYITSIQQGKSGQLSTFAMQCKRFAPTA
jgi:hypothetical protein